MPDMLPPLAAVRAFEAAARHQNFTKAADELGMTQAAISYQIRILEDRVGAPLFLRQARGVALSDVGARLLQPTSEALDLLRDAFAAARDQSEETLYISVVPTFATNILAQSLGRFQVANPSIAVRIDLNSALVDFARDNVDIAIRSGRGGWPGHRKHLLMPLNFTPMLRPDLVASIGGVQRPEDLLKLPLVNQSDPWWHIWFKAAGVSTPDLGEEPRSGFGPQVMDANTTLAGEGVGILTPAFYREDIAQNRLVQPFDLLCDDGMGLWLIYPESRRNATKIRAFRDWILVEMGTIT